MGAATSIMYAAENPDKISAIILDSGYSTFLEIVNHLAAVQFMIPPEFVQMLMMGVSIQVSQLTGGLNVSADLNPVLMAPKCTTPALFLHGEHDELVLKSHSERNYAAYGGASKEAHYFPGGHNDQRSPATVEKALQFLKKHLLASA